MKRKNSLRTPVIPALFLLPSQIFRILQLKHPSQKNKNQKTLQIFSIN